MARTRSTAIIPFTPPLLLRLISAGLEAGLVAADAVTRATAAYDHLRRHGRTTRLSDEDQRWYEHLVVAALRSPGSETGFVLAVRAAETLRLARSWQSSRVRRLNPPVRVFKDGVEVK